MICKRVRKLDKEKLNECNRTKLAPRNLEAIKPSGTVAVSEKVRELRRAGKKVIHFGKGDPDLDTPAHVRQAAIDVLASNPTHYSLLQESVGTMKKPPESQPAAKEAQR